MGDRRRSFAMIGIFILMLAAAFYVARPVLLPIWRR